MHCANSELRLLASAGILIEGEDGRFGLTPPAACSDDVLRQRLIQKGIEQVAKFSWKVAAQKVMETYQLVGAGTRRVAAAI